MRKFNKGDKVRLTKRCPKYIRDEFKTKRTKTVADVAYSEDEQCAFYILSGRGASRHGRLFRSYELKPARGLHKRGRPYRK